MRILVGCEESQVVTKAFEVIGNAILESRYE